ncbi:MAG: nucleoside kinase [Lachnospira sp.]|nr:nucleoside kinase [Lachnospira sp.]
MTLRCMAEQERADAPVVLASVNGKLKELGTPGEFDRAVDSVQFITTAQKIGMDVYRRSLVMLMLYAFTQVQKQEGGSSLHVIIEHSIGDAYYFHFRRGERMAEGMLGKVKEQMEAAVKADIPIEKLTLPTDEAIRYFASADMKEKARLFRYRMASTVNLYSMNGYRDYFYGYMVPSAGVLKWFDLMPYDEGFVLQFPSVKDPVHVSALEDQPKLFQAIKETRQLNEKLSLLTVADLNDHITAGDMNRMILVQEALQEQKIVEIVQKIREKKTVKFVLVAGPSSSGKTTFANRLAIQLAAYGYHAHIISVDNYYVDREFTPRDKSGDYDYEAIEAVDLALFNTQLQDMLSGKAVKMPRYDFKAGHKVFDQPPVQMGPGDILVIEGIHCLNDRLTFAIPREVKFKIYISALTQLNVDSHNRVSTADGRLVRRMVRDFRTRATPAVGTLSRWASVRRGEEKNIFPYQESADVVFNSAMAYELSVLKSYAQPMLFSVPEESPVYPEAKRMLKFLDYFLPCRADFVPNNSLLREFIGGGCFAVD